MVVVRDVAPFIPINTERCFVGPYCLIVALVSEADNSSETSVNTYNIIRRNIPEESIFLTLIFHFIYYLY